MRVGFGYDVHRLVEGRRLVLGGVAIPFDKGLLGHSDADVLCHAIGDALLGAAGLGDLGQHFPDEDPEYEGISSLILLERISSLLREGSFSVVNVDATVVAQSPKLGPYVQEMRERVAQALGISPKQVSVKATTNEGLGFSGEGLGMAAYSGALIAETE